MQKPEDTIKFVKEYLADPSSKTLKEVQANYAAARYATATYAAADYASYARHAAYDYVSYASYAAYADYAADAAHWVKRYEEITNART